MRLMVTGGAGFIGSAVVRTAISRGHDVLNVDKLTYAACLANVATAAKSDRYRFIQEDICNQAAISALLEEFRPDAVMNLAAETHVDRSIDGPAAFINSNIVGAYAMLEAARHWLSKGGAPKKFRFHHISTDEVYGSLGPTGEFYETTPYQPNSPYSAAKASSDMLVRAWNETFDMPAVVTNCSNNYGEYQFPEKLIPVVIINALEGKPIPIYGKGDNIRDWLYVGDHVDALLLVAEKGVAGETYNVGGRAERTNIEIVQTICAILDELAPSADGKPYGSLITYVADRPGHDKRYAINCDKIERELGWRPATKFEDGMRKTVAWYLENRDWWEDIRARGFDTAKRQGLRS